MIGLNMNKPQVGYGSSNDGNTARKFFENYDITSKITGIDVELLRRCDILRAVNSKHQINPEKFEVWKELTSTVHKVLQHGRHILESNIPLLGELK